MAFSHTYQEPEDKEFVVVEAGDYQVEVKKVETGIANSGKLSGSQKITVFLKPKGQEALVRDDLFDAPTMSWKNDRFVKCFNMRANPGEAIEFTSASLVGLRGWVRIIKEKSTKGNDFNKVTTLYIDKPPMKRNTQVELPAEPVGATTEDDDDLPF